MAQWPKGPETSASRFPVAKESSNALLKLPVPLNCPRIIQANLISFTKSSTATSVYRNPALVSSPHCTQRFCAKDSKDSKRAIVRKIIALTRKRWGSPKCFFDRRKHSPPDKCTRLSIDKAKPRKRRRPM